jgi:hypothetical protein
MTVLAFLFAAISTGEYPAKDPPVIAKMEKLGTVYLTRFDGTRRPARFRPVGPVVPIGTPKNAIIGVDFRPMAGTDPQEVVAVLKELTTLKYLQTVLVLGASVTDDAVDVLPDTLQGVHFFNTKITDKGIAKLSRFKHLVGFRYTGNELTDAGLRDIAKIRSLQSLHITDAKVTDKGVSALEALVNLRELSIQNSAASQSALDDLFAKLPRLNEPDFRSI